MVQTIDASQKKAATAVGICYLLAIPLALLSEFYIAGKLNYNFLTGSLNSVIPNAQLFRIGIASNVTVFALDIILITALYVVLKPINRNLALLALCWRLVETAVLVAALINDFDALRILNNADHLGSFDAGQLQVMAKLSLGAHSTGYKIGLFFAGLGSTLFCYLWYKSKFIPKGLALLGLFASVILILGMYIYIISPELAKTITVVYYGTPIFLFELSMGIWLLTKGIRVAKNE